MHHPLAPVVGGEGQGLEPVERQFTFVVTGPIDLIHDPCDVAARARVVYHRRMTDPIPSILQSLSAAKHALIVTHAKPDGDALGSSAALQLGLRARGIRSTVLLFAPLPAKYAFIFNDNAIDFIVIDSASITRDTFVPFDRFISVDTGTFSQLPGLDQIVPALEMPRIVIDHHRTQEAWADILWKDVTAAAAGEMVEALLSAWKVPMTASIANCLFVAMSTDTGWFQFSNTTPRTLRLAAMLMEHGVDTDALYQRLYQNENPERLLLMQRAMASLRFDADGRVASMLVRKHDFTETGASPAETESLINLPLQVARVQASVLLVEQPEGGPIRVSFRSKGQVDVAALAQQFGGGGHARASGARVDAPIDEARSRIVKQLTESLPQG